MIGDFDISEMEKAIKEHFNFKTIKKNKCDIQINYENNKRCEREVVEDSNFNQSILAIGCCLNDLDFFERNYGLTIYNIILGNSPDSKFFKNIREKNSLAYSIGSTFKKTDDLMIITAGIASDNYEKTLSLIKEEMDAMVKGCFDDADIEKAKELLISVLNDIYEYEDSIVDYYFSLNYLDSEVLDKQISSIRKITKEDIMKIAKKVKLDTIYLLKEKKGSEDCERN